MGISFSNFGGASSNTGTGFNLDVGSSGNDSFYLQSTQPAGGYSITSQLSDAEIEFYAIAEDGTLAGQTTSKSLSTTKPFNIIVAYGLTTNDLISFEFKPTNVPTASGDQDSGAAPFVTSISDADLASIDDTTIVTGGNFATDVTVTFTGTDNVVRNAKSIVRTNSTQLVVTRPDDFLQDNAPYTMVVSNPNIPQSTIKTFSVSTTAGGDPSWSTASTLTNAIKGQAYSNTLSATDPDGGPITYSIISGSLPAGLTLNSSTGEISGTPTAASAASFIVQATDSGGNTTNRSFQLASLVASGGTVTDADGYRTHTFTSNGTFTLYTADTLEVEMLGGGGGGSTGSGEWAFGGGGGSYLLATYAFPSGNTAITVGAAGPGQTECNNIYYGATGKGGNSSIGTMVASGGSAGTQRAGGPYSSGGGVAIANITTGAASVIKNHLGSNGNGGGDGLSSGGSNGLKARENDSTYGQGAAGTGNYIPGIHATGNGNGGGGGASCQNGHRGGGNGSAGIVKIRYAI